MTLCICDNVINDVHTELFYLPSAVFVTFSRRVRSLVDLHITVMLAPTKNRTPSKRLTNREVKKKIPTALWNKTKTNKFPVYWQIPIFKGRLIERRFSYDCDRFAARTCSWLAPSRQSTSNANVTVTGLGTALVEYCLQKAACRQDKWLVFSYLDTDFFHLFPTFLAILHNTSPLLHGITSKKSKITNTA